MKNKEYKIFEKISKIKYSAALAEAFISYPYVKRNIPKTNTAHMRRVNACNKPRDFLTYKMKLSLI